jgi:putative AlgH/UPF0301 family transcriptional regulator
MALTFLLLLVLFSFHFRLLDAFWFFPLPLSSDISLFAVKNEKSSFIPDMVTAVPFTGTGCILLSQPGEHDHFLNKAGVLIYEYNDEGTLGAILDRPSACTMGESSPNIGVFESNTLFLGGNEGSDMAIMVHPYDLAGYAKRLGHGMYVGGIKHAREKVEQFKAHPRDFKFIFNNVKWAPGLLEKEIEQGRWDVCCIPPSLVVRQEPKHYLTLWGEARNVLRSAGTLRAVADR